MTFTILVWVEVKEYIVPLCLLSFLKCSASFSTPLLFLLRLPITLSGAHNCPCHPSWCPLSLSLITCPLPKTNCFSCTPFPLPSFLIIPWQPLVIHWHLLAPHVISITCPSPQKKQVCVCVFFFSNVPPQHPIHHSCYTSTPPCPAPHSAQVHLIACL